MDVRDGIRSIRRWWLAAGLALGLVAPAQADPIYNVIDLGAGGVTYETYPGGNGIVLGSNGLTATFNPTPATPWPQGVDPGQGIPNVVSAPVGSGDTYGNPAYAYSHSTLGGINGQGLAAGLDDWGVSGHLDNLEAFALQRQADGSWGTPIALWAGASDFGHASGAGILGISSSGQILGYGYDIGQVSTYGGSTGAYGLFLYDSNSRSFTNLTNLIDSMKSPAGTNWFLNGPTARIDDQGRIVIMDNAYENYPQGAHSLLLVPQGTPTGMYAAPEPATWAIFAIMIGGWAARGRLRSRPRG